MSVTNVKPLIYCFSGSPFVWRALITLEEKGIEYESKWLPRSMGEHRTPDMLALNPRGRSQRSRDVAQPEIRDVGVLGRAADYEGFVGYSARRPSVDESGQIFFFFFFFFPLFTRRGARV